MKHTTPTKPYRLIRAYTDGSGRTSTYTQHCRTIDAATNAIRHIIETFDHYTFDGPKLQAFVGKGHVILTLYNDDKPAIIPIKELMFSIINDPKFNGK